MTEKEIKEYWEKSSKAYQSENKILTKSAHYGPYSPDESKLKLLGNVKGKKILELGCGAAQCGIAFSKQGAEVTGIDLSEEQLKHARDLIKSEKVKINLIQGSFQDLSKLKSQDYDIVFSAFAFQYAPALDSLFKQVFRVLKNKGIFVFSFDHPFTFVTYENRSYYNTGRYEQVEKWKDGSERKFVGYHRKVSDIFDALVKAGFLVEKIIEPFEKNDNDPWKRIYKDSPIEKMAPTIIFKARKLR